MKKENLNIVLVVLLIFSLWMNIRISGKVERLNNDLNNIDHNLGNEIRNIDARVSSTLEEIRKEALWVRESNCEITDFSDNLETATVSIAFTLKEKQKDERIYVAATSKSNNEVSKFEVPESESLTYALNNMTLSASDEYDLQVIGETSDSLRSGHLESLYLSSHKKGLVIINGELLGSHYNYEKEEGDFSFYISVDVKRKSDEIYMNFLRDLEIQSIAADIYVGDEYLDTMDLINEKNYVTVDLEDLSNSIPERESRRSREQSENKHYLYSGKYMLNEEFDFRDIKLVVLVTDNKENQYKALIGDFSHEEYDKLMDENLD